MKYLSFINKGILDPYSMMVMGATTKRGDDSKIGEYGSGWNYAIAVLLRNNIKIRVAIDGKNVVISERYMDIQGKEQRMITINGIDAMYTVELGPDWTVWMAIREIYCNSIDEGSNAVNIIMQNDMVGLNANSGGRTCVSIEITPAVQEIINNWMHYFSFERTDEVLDIPGIKVFKKLGVNSVIYRKGIRVAESTKKGCFDYDFDDIPINEIRQAKNFADVEDRLSRLMRTSVNMEVLNEILKNEGTWEKDLKFYSWQDITTPTKQIWKDTIGKRAVVPSEFSSRLLPANSSEDTIITLPAMMSELIAKNVDDVLVLGYDKGSEFAMPVEDMEIESMLYDAINMVDEIFPIDGYDFYTVNFKNTWVKTTHVGKKISVSADFIRRYKREQVASVILGKILMMENDMRSMSTEYEEYLQQELFNARSPNHGTSVIHTPNSKPEVHGFDPLPF